ncbi:hypothetical protein [Lacticigenium naphthae]|uniref:hypothetical protein n=1 Tax=Lacticigenium naphthae TaxID=515351 RepID=UPI000423D2A5|nr:hypothetical protein [Lacticigenium naphthae]
MLELIIRFVFLMVVLFGLFEFSLIELNIKKDFIPLFVFSSIGLVSFMAGLLNVMQESILILIGFSLFYLIYLIVNRKLRKLFPSLGMSYFLGMIAYLAILLKGVRFSEYDDFSHWGLVARELVLNDQMPNFASELITFQSYPTGSANFMYFIGKILGESEGILLFGQSLLLLASITVFFAFVKKNKIVNTVLILIATLFFFTANNSIFMLSVDTLLTLIGLGVTAILLHNFREKTMEKSFLVILPILAFLMIIKNSSILFVLINSILYAGLLLKSKGINNKNLSLSVMSFAVPYFFSYLWTKHVDFVFPSGREAKHSVSLENYQAIMESKTPEDIELITKTFLDRMVNTQTPDVRIFMMVLVTFLVVALSKMIFRRNGVNNYREWKLFCSSILLYIVYQAGLWAMYLFSMPIGEAINLAGYERYNLTIVMYLYGLLLIYFLVQNQKTVFSKPATITLKTFSVILLAVYLFLPGRHDVSDLLGKYQSPSSVRSIFSDVIEGEDIPETGEFYIYKSDNDRLNKAGILTYIAKYELRSPYVKIINKSNIEEVITERKNAHVVLIEKDEYIMDLLERNNLDGSKMIIQIN